jgi:hypothetical protein
MTVLISYNNLTISIIKKDNNNIISMDIRGYQFFGTEVVRQAK